MLYEKIIYGANQSFGYKQINKKYFPLPMHHHTDYEIIYIDQGHGKRFIGTNVHDFKAGDLVLIGESIPHFHLCDKIYYENNDLRCKSKVIHFKIDVFPKNINQLPEFDCVYNLLQRAIYGIKFNQTFANEFINQLFMPLESLQGIERLTYFYKLLDELGRITDFSLITNHDYRIDNSTGEESSVPSKVYNYLIKNFKNEISLKQIACHVNQNPSSLCRYFKKITKKSIFDCLNEIRIGYAYKLLAKDEYTISQIAYESGFNNLSNFNRQFRKYAQKSPSEYRSLVKNSLNYK